MLVKLRITIVIAFLLFAADAFFLNQFLVVLLTIFIGTPVFLVKLVLSRKDRERRGILLAKAGIYLGMIILIVAAFFANNAVAERRAQTIIAACERYRAKTGGYPEQLSQLVPEYLAAIPLAKPLVWLGGPFMYMARPGDHGLSYVTVPPYGRRCYLLEQKKWQSFHD